LSAQWTELLPTAKIVDTRKQCKNKYVRALNQLRLSQTKMRRFCRFQSEIFAKKVRTKAVALGLYTKKLEKDMKQGRKKECQLFCEPAFGVSVVRVYSTRGTTWYGVTTVGRQLGQQLEQYWLLLNT
jgi:hypothetical protein